MIEMRKLFGLVAVVPLAIACGDDEGGNGGDGNGNGNGNQPGNIVEVAQEAGSFETLLQTASDLGLAETLSGPGPFTVFAPTDGAFNALQLDLSQVEDAVLTNIILAHVADGDLGAGALASAGTVDTLARITHDFDAAGPSIRGATIAMPDVDASNGVIHVLDDVIVPPTILEAAGELGFSELAAAIGNASSATQGAVDPDTLGGDMPITVFAPTNAAFGGVDLGEEDLDAVLATHVVMGQVLSTDLTDGQVITTVQGSQLTVGIDGSSVTLTDPRGNTYNVVTPDVRTLTGTIHAIDGVLLPSQDPEPGNIVDVARDAGNFETLLTVAGQLGLDQTLTSPGPFTVFAPTDAAFNAVPADLSAVSADVVENILRAHVAEGELSATALTDAGSVATLANISHEFDGAASPPTVRGAPVATPDIDASNGIVHAMDAVIVPPTILQLASELGFTELANAVGAASPAIADALDPDTLGGADPITVFAPTNAAFEAAELSQEDLDAVLSYHVVAGQVLSSDLTDGQVVTTVQGSELTVNKDGSAVTLTDARGNTFDVATPDVRTLSGVIHVIDGVLLPERNIVQIAQADDSFTTLVQVASDLGLVPTLSGPGPLTVFAPTDAAFAAVPADLSAVNADVVENIVLAHVADGELTAADLIAAGSVETLANIAHVFDGAATPPTVRGAAVDPSALDISASNGIIHTMDAVIVPPTILQLVDELGFTEAAAAVGAASPAIATALDPNTLAGADPITVFAPTNAAFQGADLSGEDLDSVLQYHVVAGQNLAGSLGNGAVITTALGASLTVNVDGSGNISLTDGRGNTVNVVSTDVRTLSGVVHTVDGVLLPPQAP